MMSKSMWLAWEDDTSIRSKVLADELNADYRAYTRFAESRYFGFLRYPVATAQTVWAMASRRPAVLVVQNPSILLAFEAALLRRIFGYRLVIDLHTPFFNARGIKLAIANALHTFSLRNCNAVIVTNEGFKQRVGAQTPKPVMVLPDKIPELKRGSAVTVLKGRINIAYICTFSVDEPWREVLEAARQLPDDVCIYITGRHKLNPADVPANVVLTGYLSREDYENLLHSVDAVMVLTTADQNLVCGGYEAVAVGKPLILSDTQTLREFFRKGTVFTGNRSEDIARTIMGLDGAVQSLADDIRALKDELSQSWDQRWRALLEHLHIRPRVAPSA